MKKENSQKKAWKSKPPCVKTKSRLKLENGKFVLKKVDFCSEFLKEIMSFVSTLSGLLRIRIPVLQKQCTLMNIFSKSAYHSFFKGNYSLIAERLCVNNLLAPKQVFLLPERGLKYKGYVKRRCKDCYFVMRDGRLYNMCKTHPRHKQALLQKKEKYTWVITHATQSPVRPW